MLSFVAGLGFETKLLVDPLRSRDNRGSSLVKEVSAYIYVSGGRRGIDIRRHTEVLSFPK